MPRSLNGMKNLLTNRVPRRDLTTGEIAFVLYEEPIGREIGIGLRQALAFLMYRREQSARYLLNEKAQS